MIDYSKMSDFEVNKSVALNLGKLVKVEFDEGMIGFTEKYHKEYPDTIFAADLDHKGSQCSAWEQKNYTKDPSDAWPIIASNKIDIHFSDFETNFAHGGRVDLNGVFEFSATHKNPLRAAMIVFLMMKGKENDNKE